MLIIESSQYVISVRNVILDHLPSACPKRRTFPAQERLPHRGTHVRKSLGLAREPTRRALLWSCCSLNTTCAFRCRIDGFRVESHSTRDLAEPTQSSPKACKPCNSAAHSHDSYRRRCVRVLSPERTHLPRSPVRRKLTRTQNLRYAPLHLCVKTVACAASHSAPDASHAGHASPQSTRTHTHATRG